MGNTVQNCRRIVFGSFRGNEHTRMYGTAHKKLALKHFSEEFPDSEIITDAVLCVNTNAPMLAYSPDTIMDADTLLEVKGPSKLGAKYLGSEPT